MNRWDPLDLDGRLRGLSRLIGLRPGAITLRAPPGNADHRPHHLGMFHRVADRQVAAPRVPHHDPGLDTDRLTDGFQVGDSLLHRVRAAAGATNASWLRVPRPVTRRRELVSLQVLHTARSTR